MPAPHPMGTGSVAHAALPPVSTLLQCKVGTLQPEAGTPWRAQHYPWTSPFLPPWSSPVGICWGKAEDRLAQSGPSRLCTALISAQLATPDHNFQVTVFLWTPGPHQCLIIMSSHTSDLFQAMHFATQFPPATGGRKKNVQELPENQERFS